MACRDNITQSVLADIKEIIGVNRTSARELSGNRILLSINKDNPSLLTKENTVEWGKALAKKINDKYKSKIYGTIIYVNTRKYDHGTELTWEIPMKLIDAYEDIYDNEDQSPVATKIGKYQSEVDKLTDRIRTLERALSANKSDKVKKAEIEAKIQVLKNRKEQLEIEDKLADVISYGNNDIKEVELLLTKDNISESDLFYANKILHQWETALPNLFTETDLRRVEGQFSPNVQAVQNIITTAQVLRETYTKVFNNAVLEMFKRQGVNATEEQIFGAKREIGALSANLLDISRTNDIIFQVTAKMIKDANYDTEQEVIKTVKEVDDLFDAVKKTTEYKTKGFDIFIQEKEGKKTGMLTTRFSSKFYETSTKLRNIARKSKDSTGWKSYFDWKRQNTILFDPRKLFNDIYTELDGEEKYSQEAITEHIKELKQQLGENGYKEYYSRLEPKINLYKEDLEANKDRINALELDQVDKDTMLKEWLLVNSPFVYAKTVETAKVEKLGDKFIRPKGYKYTTEVPRKYTDGLKKTDWYDAKFEVIENNPALYNFYRYTIDKYDSLYDYLPDYAIEDLQYNYLPEISKNIVELFSDKGLKGGMGGWYDKVISELTTDNISDVSNAERDPITGKLLKTLPITMLGNRLAAEEKSYDIVKITKAFSLMALSYKHKAKIEDSIRILEQVVNSSTEMQTNAEGKQLSDAFGRPIATKDGLKNYKAQYEYAIESMVYGKRRIEEGISKKKLLTTEEKAARKLLLAKLKDANEEDKKSIQAEIDALGSNIVASKGWDKVLEFAQIKGMGWNLFAPVNNTVFAFVSNMIHAAGGEDFNYPQFLKAQRIMLNSVGKSASLDTYTSKTANKINKLMEDWNVVGEIDQAGYKSTAFESTAAKGFKKLAPYELTKRSEYLNQGSTFVAMMLGTPIKDLTGKERDLWEAYDSNGKWNTKEFGEEISLEEKKKFKNRLEQVKKSIHGNYDPSSAVKIKKTTLGRAVLMFRSWAAEGFANRFEAEKDDLLLGRKRKGRLITLKEQGIVKGPLLILGQMANFLTFGGAFKANLDSLSAVDKANMRKNSAEVLLYLSLYSLVLILKSIDSDDDDEKKAINALLNVSFRVQNDMAFFTSPLAFEKITQSSIPAMSIVTDAAKLVEAMQKTIMGDPYYKNGNHRGEARVKIALAKNLPLTVQIERAYQGISKAAE